MTNVSNHDHQSLTSLGNVTTWFRVEQPLFTCSKHTSHTIQQNKRHLTSCSWLFIILLEVTRHSGHLWKKHINTTQQLEKHSPFNNNNNFYQYITHMTFSFLSLVFQNKANNLINLKKTSDSPDLLFLSHLQNIADCFEFLGWKGETSIFWIALSTLRDSSAPPLPLKSL